MSLSLDDAKEAQDEAREGNLRENEAGIPDELAYDYEQYDAPIVQGHPETLVTYDHVAALSVFNSPEDFLQLRQNLEAQHYTDQNDIVVTLADPELVEGELWAYPDDEFKDYKIVGDVTQDDNPYEKRSEVKREDGDIVGENVKGINFGAADFDGEPVEGGFDTKYIQVIIGAKRATTVLGLLDTAGRWARDSDGNVTEGIIEAPPKLGSDEYDSETHGAPRAIGYPELRADMVGQRGAVSWTFTEDEPTTQSPVSLDFYKVTDDGLEALTPLTPNQDAYALPTYPRANNFYWDENDDGIDADAEPETDNGVAEAAAEMQADDGEMTYGDLNDDEQDFVDTAVDAVQTKGYDSAWDFGDFEERVEAAKAEGEIYTPANSLADIVDERVN